MIFVMNGWKPAIVEGGDGNLQSQEAKANTLAAVTYSRCTSTQRRGQPLGHTATKQPRAHEILQSA